MMILMKNLFNYYDKKQEQIQGKNTVDLCWHRSDTSFFDRRFGVFILVRFYWWV